MSSQVSFEAYRGSAAESYERHFVPAVAEPLARELVEIAALRPGERVLDVACGTGVVARLAAERVGAAGRVAGADLNPGMLAVARAAAPGAAPIAWHEAAAEALPFPDESFDAVLCQLGLQFVSDRPAALRQMRRVLVPGGRLLLNVPGPTPPVFSILEDALADVAGPEAAAFVGAVFSLHDAAEVRELLRVAGFRDAEASSSPRTLRLAAPGEFLWQYVHGTPLAAVAVELDDERRAALERSVVAGWEPYTEGGALTLRVDVTVASARR